MSVTSAFESLSGRWITSGEVFAEDGESSIARIEGTDEYRLLGDSFLVHTVDVSIGGQRVEALEMIGPDEGTNVFPTRAFDSSGSFEESTAEFDGKATWIFRSGEAEANLTIADDGASMSADWIRTVEGREVPWMRLKLVREPIVQDDSILTA